MYGSWQFVLPVNFVIYSLPLFLRVNVTSQFIIDEEFHIPQGLAFCRKQFDVWDSKITTFPGLYIFALLLSPFNACNSTGLRFLSLIAAGLNISLLYKIRCRRLHDMPNKSMAALEAITISVLPPLYFFSHLYYTDTLAVTMVLLFYSYWQSDAHLPAAVFGAASVLMRQTNIVWVCMCCGITGWETVLAKIAKFSKLKNENVSLLNFKTIIQLLDNPTLLLNCILAVLGKCCFYISIILPFIGFIFINGSIVVGDKSAHEATLHIPQLFYYSVFVLFFGISNTLQQMKSALNLFKRHMLISMFCATLLVMIIKFNTMVHPYLLADNRHYIFYIWNRLYGRYSWFRYAMVPIYMYALAILFCGIQHERESFKVMYWLSIFLVLCFQRLLELRYFIVPFVIYRLNTRPSRKILPVWLELVSNLLINVVTFYIFFTKEFYWTNYKTAQHIIW